MVCKSRFTLLVADVTQRKKHQASPDLAGRMSVVISALLLTALLASPAAATRLDGAEVSKLIIDALAAQNLKAAPLVSTTRKFPACDNKIDVKPMFGSWHTVSVQCSKKGGWRFAIRTNAEIDVVSVPVRNFKLEDLQNTAPPTAADKRIEAMVTRPKKSAKSAEIIEVLALSRSMSRNDVITTDDVISIGVPKRNVSGAFFKAKDIIGRRMKTSISANKPVQARHLHPNFMVEEKNEVLITSQAGAIRIDMVGWALEDGQLGDWIKVENAASGKIILAKIIGEKKVAVIAKKS